MRPTAEEKPEAARKAPEARRMYRMSISRAGESRQNRTGESSLKAVLISFPSPVTVSRNAAPAIGGCLRGLLWALTMEGALAIWIYVLWRLW